jgi:hypothetical protein
VSAFVINSYAFGGEDADAKAYLDAVESADTQALEAAVRRAVDDFVKGCKADGIWSAIKASCILAGARTLAGALTPLVGSAPTNVSNLFVSGDYNRETGLVGNGSTKYLNTSYAYGSGLQNNKHGAVYVSSVQTSLNAYFGSSLATLEGEARTQIIILAASTNKISTRCSNSTTVTSSGNNNANGLQGVSRAASGSYTQRGNATNETIAQSSESGAENSMFVFARNVTNSFLQSSARIAFYSFGEALALADLDTRVSTLITDLDAAI